MNARLLTNKNTGRVELGKALPLDTPFSVQMFVANTCNFRCAYCLQSHTKKILKDMSFSRKLMKFDLYKKCIDGFKDLPGKLKILVLAGWGEPLLHPRLAEMIQYAKAHNVTDKVEIITNSYALTPALADQLIKAGLDSMRISIQGLCAGDYRQASGVDINFDQFVANLKYFYEHKKSTNVYIKIMDIMLKKPGDREKFFDIFGNLCDEIAVESLIPMLPEFDYSKFGSDFSTELMGNKLVETDICALPFYSCIIDVDGRLLPCGVFPPPAGFDNVAEKGLAAVWRGPEYNAFLIKLLKREKAQIPVCNKCKRHIHVMRPSDYLDDYAEDLIPLYERLEAYESRD
ncbi:tungsten-containing aldehyde ferredoxin oxidoreductase cofactor modifying protein [Desulfocucumis palustris]|uniref:Tungsten-containing aldehyde ferredoxin oxidoreductase cofactor modifying protein n=1 Tax=Desulfocucumis palustris TaxID=1898651 RepID=A0A2L2XHT2_9FIRM|nr:radical SAM protein [Desulfocucumis palustris]GBF33441.1 tungsten-containing aldehyde ferredoxin oxidoreductase cofactor modifying protein [Desulfocucumis palustris]